MPKRQASEAAPTPVQEKKKKPSNEIDEIFASKKKKQKPKEEQPVMQKENSNAKPMNVKKNNKGHKKNALPNPSSGPRKRTNDGLAIYTEDELGVSKADAGNSPLCPFDCSCCF
ncbi:hypothetical protein Scep_008191 [Stephania cephalantha]|uniref:DUF1764 domain-containing protein n=1 Tax=Stephania cephalantha TaxID=152367 RepID=A0AAP0KD61_9MAGN